MGPKAHTNAVAVAVSFWMYRAPIQNPFCGDARVPFSTLCEQSFYPERAGIVLKGSFFAENV